MPQFVSNLFLMLTENLHFSLLLLFLTFYILTGFLRFLFLSNVDENKKINLFLRLPILIIRRLDMFFWLVIYLYFYLQLLPTGTELDSWINKIALIIFSVYATLIMQRVISTLVDLMIKRREDEEEIDQTVVLFIKSTIKILLWILLLLFVLQNLNFQISALLGGLGVAGLAVSLAFQSVLQDVFSFLLIYFDRPFRVGDYIAIGKDSGTVKKIGIRSSTLKTIQGQELIIPNRELSSARIENYKRMQSRLVVVSILLDYKNSSQNIEKAKKIVAKVFDRLEKAEFVRANLRELSSSGLKFEIVYRVTSSSFDDYIEVNEKISLEILEKFKKAKINLANVQTVLSNQAE